MELTKLERYLELKAQEADITKELNALKKEIKEQLPVGETIQQDIKVQRRLQTRIDLDKEQVLIKLGADAYKACEKISEYEVVTVRRVK